MPMTRADFLGKHEYILSLLRIVAWELVFIEHCHLKEVDRKEKRRTAGDPDYLSTSTTTRFENSYEEFLNQFIDEYSEKIVK